MHHATLGGVVMCLLLVSCATPPRPANIDPVDQPYQEAGRVQYLSRGLSRYAKIVSDPDKIADRVDGLLRVRLEIKNDADRDVVVEIKVTFTDEQGFEREATNWEPVILTRRDITSYSRVSLGRNVYDYRIAIRDPKVFSPDG